MKKALSSKLLSNHNYTSWCYRFVPLNTRATIPFHSTKYSAGLDLCSAIDFDLERNHTALIPTGLKVEFYQRKDNIKTRISLFRPYILITSRSGLAKKGIITVSSGIIDCDYKGEIFVLLTNIGLLSYHHIRVGDRIAQALVNVIIPYDHIYYSDLIDSGEYENIVSFRGEGGFGSTGT